MILKQKYDTISHDTKCNISYIVIITKKGETNSCNSWPDGREFRLRNNSQRDIYKLIYISVVSQSPGRVGAKRFVPLCGPKKVILKTYNI